MRGDRDNSYVCAHDACWRNPWTANLDPIDNSLIKKTTSCVCGVVAMTMGYFWSCDGHRKSSEKFTAFVGYNSTFPFPPSRFSAFVFLFPIFPVADPGFSPGGGANSPSGCANLFFGRKLHENERILAPGGGGARPWRPPLDPPLISSLCGWTR